MAIIVPLLITRGAGTLLCLISLVLSTRLFMGLEMGWMSLGVDYTITFVLAPTTISYGHVLAGHVTLSFIRADGVTD